MAEQVERRLAAILAADVVGYSRLMGADEAGTHARLKALRLDLIDPKIAEHRGRVVKRTGDGALVEFASAVDAVRCAVEIQQIMAARNRDMAEVQRIEFRVGINLSDVIVEDGDIFGDGVNVAARLEGLAQPGGVCISDVVHQMVRGRLDLAFEDLGEQRVKNIALPVQAWHWTNSAPTTRLPVSSAGHVTARLPDKPSLAVLPFDNLSADPEQTYFSDGMTEDLITDLSQISELFVTSRHASFQYKNQAVPPQQVARDLGVRYVLEGSVRRAGGRVRINAQLIDATSGFHLWAQRYDRDFEDIFALQDEIVHAIVDALEVKLTSTEEERLARRYSSNIEAYDLYLRGFDLYRRKSKAAIASARRLFESAIELDPGFAAAYARLSHVRFHEWELSEGEDREAADQALELAEKAVTLNSSSPEAHEQLGFVCFFIKKEFERGIAEVRCAIDLDPNYAKGYAKLAELLAFAGRPEESVHLVEKAMRLEPYIWNHWYQWVLGLAYHAMGQLEDALTCLKKCLVGDPDFPPAHRHLVVVYAELERIDEARSEAAEVLRLVPDFSLDRFVRMWPVNDQRYLQRIITGMRKAHLPE